MGFFLMMSIIITWISFKHLIMVKLGDAVIIERLGIYNRTLHSGVHFYIPFLEKIKSEEIFTEIIEDRKNIEQQYGTLARGMAYPFGTYNDEVVSAHLYSDNYEEKVSAGMVLNYVFTTSLKLLHPFMPFVTEEIYQKYNEGSIVISSWPEVKAEYAFKDSKYDVKSIETIFDIIKYINITNFDKINYKSNFKWKGVYGNTNC